jgi:hypothetical protein
MAQGFRLYMSCYLSVFWLSSLILANIGNAYAAHLRCDESSTPLIGDAGSRQLPALGIRRVVDSPHQKYADSILREFKLKIGKILAFVYPEIPPFHKICLRICMTNFGGYGECT